MAGTSPAMTSELGQLATQVAGTRASANRKRGQRQVPVAVMAGLVPRLSGSFFVDKAHGVDSSVFQAFGDVSDREKDQAMLHQNSVFHGPLKHVPWDRFDRLVEDHGADTAARRSFVASPGHDAEISVPLSLVPA